MAANLKVGFFFGAGAEVSYGLPLGGRFALEIFREPTDDYKEILREMIGNIDSGSHYATQWLPEGYADMPVYAFSRREFNSLIESTLEYRRESLLSFFESFDTNCTKLLDSDESPLSYKDLDGAIHRTTGNHLGDRGFDHLIELNSALAADEGLFASQYFSGLLSMLQEHPEHRALCEVVVALLQMYLGAHGHDLVQSLNERIFEKAPSDLPIFDELAGLFRLELSEVGTKALDIVVNRQEEYRDCADGEPAAKFACFGYLVLEELFAQIIDYQALIDEHFRYLYQPKARWAKFTKVATFLFAVRGYIRRFRNKLNDAKLAVSDGYYHDLVSLQADGADITAVGTANYNNLLERIVRLVGGETVGVRHLNGSVFDFYDPYRNRQVRIDNDDDLLEHERLVVPFLLTQSGIKPMTSIEMSRKYVRLYDDLKASDVVVVAGYGFNSDDGHINGLFRSLVEEADVRLVQLHYEADGSGGPGLRSMYRRHLRLESDENLHVLTVDGSRSCDGDVWTKKLRELVTDG